MGLPKGEPVHRRDGVTRVWALPGALLLLCAAIAVLGDAGRRALRFERSQIADGEIWRLISGHLTHLGLQHLLLNIAGLLLVWYLVGRRFTSAEWLAVGLASIASIDVGLWCLMPELQWYVGLSGLLHGLLAAGLVPGWGRRRTESVVLGAILIGKLIYENMLGPLPGSVAAAGGPVVVAAHLQGALGGALAAVLLRARHVKAQRGQNKLRDSDE